MSNVACILILAAAYAWLFTWAFRHLPGEQWQIMASVPEHKGGDQTWAGVNFTYYGLWTATGVTVGLTVYVILTGSVAVPPAAAGALAAGLLAVTVPAAKLLAERIERKPHTFTIGGAASVGFLVAPWLLLSVSPLSSEWLGGTLPLTPLLAALGIAYAFGEGTGRLACISFGCCYGKPLTDVSPALARIFRRLHFVFHGPTKKAAYEAGLETIPLVPIQGITAAVSAGAGLAGLALFAEGRFAAAFLTTVLVTQLWRALSESLRSDHRGSGRYSAYQIMACFNAFYAVVVVLLVPRVAGLDASFLRGLAALWSPAAILGLQLCWALIFLYTGRSRVTGSLISFSVMRDRI